LGWLDKVFQGSACPVGADAVELLAVVVDAEVYVFLDAGNAIFPVVDPHKGTIDIETVDGAGAGSSGGDTEAMKPVEPDGRLDDRIGLIIDHVIQPLAQRIVQPDADSVAGALGSIGNIGGDPDARASQGGRRGLQTGIAKEAMRKGRQLVESIHLVDYQGLGNGRIAVKRIGFLCAEDYSDRVISIKPRVELWEGGWRGHLQKGPGGNTSEISVLIITYHQVPGPCRSRGVDKNCRHDGSGRIDQDDVRIIIIGYIRATESKIRLFLATGQEIRRCNERKKKEPIFFQVIMYDSHAGFLIRAISLTKVMAAWNADGADKSKGLSCYYFVSMY